MCPAVNFKNDVRKDMLLFRVPLHDVLEDEKQKNGAYFTEGPEYTRIDWRVCESSDRF